MADAFYPFTESGDERASDGLTVTCACRIAVYDDEAAAPRVVCVEPADVRSYLEAITQEVSRLSREQGGGIPFMVIREVVENFIHAYFSEPTISILDGGDTIRFSDQGPGIADKDRAMEFGTSSASAEMKRYIRGVGSGLPYAQQYLEDKGGSLTIEDNIGAGTVVTISLVEKDDGFEFRTREPEAPAWPQAHPGYGYPTQPQPQQAPAYGYAPQPGYGYAPQAQQPWGYAPQPAPWQAQQAAPQQPWQPPAYAQQTQAPQGFSAAGTDWTDAGIVLDEREKAVMDYLSRHENAGPTDLVGAYGPSQATWSRKLKGLEARGFVAKHGQKFYLRDAGRAWIRQNLPNQAR